MARDPRRASTSRGRVDLRDLARPARGQVVAGQRPVVTAPPSTQAGSPSGSAGSSRRAPRRCWDRDRARVDAGSPGEPPRPRRAGSGAAAASRRTADDTLNPRFSLRAVHHRRRQPARARRRPGRRRTPGPGLQPALPPRPAGPRQDPPPACDRQLRARVRRRRRRSATRPSRRSPTTSSARSSSRSLDRFKHAYRDADVLLIDDVQFLASKAKTEEEFFHTFNTLYETGRQLVLTCDRLPRQLVSVEERLRERFESGLVVDVRPPDCGTRVAILRKRAALDHIHARRRRGPRPRSPTASPQRARARGRTDPRRRLALADRPSDRPRARQPGPRRDVSAPPERRRGDDRATSSASSPPTTSLTVAELISAIRTARIAWPRQVAIHLARELTHASLPAIGAAFGGRNHATVLHACKRVSERRHTPIHRSATSSPTSAAAVRGEQEGDRPC